MAESACPTSPSSASVCGVFTGQKYAWPKFLGHWALRSLLIVPGFAIAGVRGKQLFLGALGSSAMISLFLVAYTAVERSRGGHGVHYELARSRKRRALAARSRRQLANRHHRRLLAARS